MTIPFHCVAIATLQQFSALLEIEKVYIIRSSIIRSVFLPNQKNALLYGAILYYCK